MSRVATTVLCALTLLFLVPVQAGAAFGNPDTNSCSIEVNDPHISTGAGGVIAKTRWRCDDVTPVKGIYHAMYLWLCDREPQLDYEWLQANCIAKAVNYEQNMKIADATPDFTTRYVPPLDQSGAHGDGYWLQEVIWESKWWSDESHVSNTHVKFSNVVRLTT
jgi:hypothetical protein